MRTTPLLLLPVALFFASASVPAASAGEANKKAQEASEKMAAFLSEIGVPARKAEETAKAYLEYRALSESERKKALDACIAHVAANDVSEKDKAKAKSEMAGKGWGWGSGGGAKAKSVQDLHNKVTRIQKDDPREYEALILDEAKRHKLMKQYGIAEDEFDSVEACVFGDLHAKRTLFRVRDELKERGLDGQDAYWLFDRLPLLPKLYKPKP